MADKGGEDVPGFVEDKQDRQGISALQLAFKPYHRIYSTFGT